MRPDDPEADASRLAAESLAAGDATGWFERLYAEAADGRAVVPWDRGGPNPRLVEWAEWRALDGSGRRALVVGCGLGGDAEYVAARGFETVAFDIAPTAIETARARFPDSPVEYVVADVLDAPSEWRRAFDFVLESITVQALPDEPRPRMIAAIGEFVAPGGTLLVMSNARGADETPQGPPWPLTRADVESFARGDLRAVRIEHLRDEADPSIHRWRAEFERTAGAIRT